ncbi:nucleotide exchange factor GrpE [Akkermansia muciniphila]|uniref:nucleotide exchange factor GrpE n=1 Tax=Akkermansia muciniphila TaxID=239935 RepID=UPI00138E7FC0|nr:nucleotide exchange factor GrpE [Akkermansia muciniphila]QHV14310.1 nucleotide exchange factor GrpE [Akkermansia muciniphila]QHV16781.1 nucleotide exchange factor GrpE [Akkermansia muciniphila]
MSDEEKEKNAEAEELEAQEQGQDAPAEEKVAEPSLEEELLKWRDTAMRTAAEYDNYRKRMVKEKEECTKFANQRLLEELLPVIDNFEMGMAAASADASSMIYIGMSMVKKQLDEFLAGNGVSAVEPVVGSMFDHATEEALQREPSDQPEGTVLRVIRKGYMLKDRLLRPANVVVAHTPEPEPQV